MSMYGTEVHEVSFRCPDKGEQPARLTNAQKHLWDIVSLYEDGAPQLNLAATVEVSPGKKLSHVLACVRWIVERHDALRSYYERTGEVDPCQGVLLQGVIPVRVVTARQPQLVAAASETTSDLQGSPFDMSSKLLLRCAVIVMDDEPRKIIFVFCRLNVDGWSKAIIGDELTRALEDGPQHLPPPAGRSPLEQASWERSLAGLEDNRIAIDHWRDQLQLFPRAMFVASSPSVEAPRWWKAEIKSRRLEASCHALASQHRVSIATILASAFSLYFAYMNRTDFCAMSVVVANHFQPELISSVGNFPQNAPVFLDLQGSSFQKILRGTEGGALQAYTCGSCWPPDIDSEIRTAGDRRGIKIELDILFNFGAQVGRNKTSVPLVGDLEADDGPTFRWRSSAEFDHNRFYIESFDPSMVLFTADTQFMSKEDVRRVLHGVETLICRVAAGFQGSPWDLVRESGVGRFEPGVNWALVDHCWVDLQAISDRISRTELVRDCAVFPLARDAGEVGLVVYLVSDRTDFDAREMFVELKKDLFQGRTTMLPKRYVRCDAAPTVIGSEQSWKRCNVLEEGAVFGSSGLATAGRGPAKGSACAGV